VSKLLKLLIKKMDKYEKSGVTASDIEEIKELFEAWVESLKVVDKDTVM